MTEPTGGREKRQYEPSVERLVYQTPWIDFFYDDITHHDGTPGKYAWVRNHSGNGAVTTIPVTPSERYLLIKIYRHPIKRYLWEFPAGLVEPGESPEETGRRELAEETGITAERVELLGSQTPVGGYSGDVFHSVLAEIPEISLNDVVLQSEEQIVDAKLLTRGELTAMLKKQEVGDGNTFTCLAHYWMWQDRQAGSHQKER